MRDKPSITAILETGETGIPIEQETLTQKQAQTLGYRPQNYREFTEKALENNIFDVPNYHTVADKLLETPSLLYEQELIQEQVKNEIDRHLDLLRENRDRTLNKSEMDAVISTSLNERIAPKRSLDKQEIIDRLYMNVYRESDIHDTGLDSRENKV